MMKTILSVMALLLLAGCCGVPVMNGNNMPDNIPVEKIIGVYQGTLPCADCAGINTELTLSADQTFTLKETYLKDSKTLASSITGHWQRDGGVIELFPKASEENERLCYGVSSAKVLMRYDISCMPIRETILDYSLKKQ